MIESRTFPALPKVVLELILLTPLPFLVFHIVTHSIFDLGNQLDFLDKNISIAYISHHGRTSTVKVG